MKNAVQKGEHLGPKYFTNLFACVQKADSLAVSQLTIHIYTYTYTHVPMYTHVCMCIYTYTYAHRRFTFQVDVISLETERQPCLSLLDQTLLKTLCSFVRQLLHTQEVNEVVKHFFMLLKEACKQTDVLLVKVSNFIQ